MIYTRHSRSHFFRLVSSFTLSQLTYKHNVAESNRGSLEQAKHESAKESSSWLVFPFRPLLSKRGTTRQFEILRSYSLLPLPYAALLCWRVAHALQYIVMVKCKLFVCNSATLFQDDYSSIYFNIFCKYKVSVASDIKLIRLMLITIVVIKKERMRRYFYS